jgi:hypothetical protein
MSMQFAGGSVNFSGISAGSLKAMEAAVAIMNGDPVNVAMSNGMVLPFRTYQDIHDGGFGNLSPSNVVEAGDFRAIGGVVKSQGPDGLGV